MQPPEIAIITPNVLMGIGLKTILEKVIPMAETTLFGDFESFREAAPERFFHYFVSTQLFLAHAAFFSGQNHKTILLTDGHPRAAYAGMHTLNVFTCEERLVHDILHMHRGAHPNRQTTPAVPATTPLTEREREVLSLIARGCISKQIAAALSISLTTVITHRRNIMEKLHVRSVAELLLHAISAGYLEAEQI